MKQQSLLTRILRHFNIEHLRPSYWFLNYAPNSCMIDDEITQLAAKEKLTFRYFNNGVIDPFYVYLGEYAFWTKNYPYACFTAEIGKDMYIPSRKVISLLRQKMESELPAEFWKKYQIS